MKPLSLIETTPGKFSLLLNAGTTAVDDTIEELGHEPNGYFWEGIASLLVSANAPELASRFDYDPEAGMFCAYGTDREALQKLGELMAPVANDPAALQELVNRAKADGFEFDD
jgi:hypothetical protein